MKKLITTLLYIIKNDKILLAEKKRGLGMGMLNGVGGKLEKNETIINCLLREVKEEIGIVPLGLEQIGTIYFDYEYKGVKTQETTYAFVANDFEGVLIESEEVTPKWFNKKELPFDRMFPNDKIWLPFLIDKKNFTAYLTLDKNFNPLTYDIKIKD